MKTWKIAGINFDHLHMGDNLRMAYEHPQVDIVGICHEDPARMHSAIDNFQIPSDRVFTDYQACLEKARPDIVLLCPATAHHGEWTEKIAPFGVHIIMEKPFAASLPEADRMIAAMQSAGKWLAINWPLAWYPPHLTTKRLIDEDHVGEVLEVHYYDGNRGPLWHVADKVETTQEEVDAEKSRSWFYKKDHGGGSLLDYLGYGTTLGTWFQGGRKPLEVTAVVDEPQGLEVDEHSITIARY
ncbi:MAG: Gfo/Idh/MocA family oxidoreductase, partial [Candidatus Hydrogenedentes bacterium]|nr:Gfo/Idh/MocA family oxidoreductase [Candidatus Hydrogenedentota bacterium]